MPPTSNLAPQHSEARPLLHFVNARMPEIAMTIERRPTQAIGDERIEAFSDA
jgi:hypothetical protein